MNTLVEKKKSEKHTRKIKIFHNLRKHDYVDMNKKSKVDSIHDVIIPVTQFVYLKSLGRLKSLLKPSEKII